MQIYRDDIGEIHTALGNASKSVGLSPVLARAAITDDKWPEDFFASELQKSAFSEEASNDIRLFYLLASANDASLTGDYEKSLSIFANLTYDQENATCIQTSKALFEYCQGNLERGDAICSTLHNLCLADSDACVPHLSAILKKYRLAIQPNA